LPSTPAADVEFGPGGGSVLTTSENHTATVWEPDTGKIAAEFLGTAGFLWLGRFSPDGAMVVTSGSDLTAQIWAVDPGAPAATLTARPGGDGQAAALDPSGDLVYTGGYAGLVHTWDMGSGRLERTFPVFPSSHERYVDWVWSIAVSPDGSTIAVSGTRRMIRIVDARSGDILSALRFAAGEGPGSPGAGRELAGVTWSVAFSPDGSLLASASQDGVARLWDPYTGELVRRLSGHEAAVNFLAFSPDGTMLITGSDDGTGRIWNVQDGSSLIELEGQPQGVTSVAWSPDGKLLATTSYDGTVFIRDATSGEPVHRLTGSSGVILAAAFSPDSRWLATSADEEGALRVWDARTGRLADIHEGTLHSTGFSVGFSPDGDLIALPGYTGPFGSGIGETLIYRCELCVDLDGLLDVARERVTRSLTDQERERFLHEL
jgi:WD40 repeat protein